MLSCPSALLIAAIKVIRDDVVGDYVFRREERKEIAKTTRDDIKSWRRRRAIRSTTAAAAPDCFTVISFCALTASSDFRRRSSVAMRKTVSVHKGIITFFSFSGDGQN